MKNKFYKKKSLCIFIIIGAIIIPLLYSYFYLGAFWDPYSRLNKLPIAVVNNDLGYVINGDERNVGQEMCETLKKDGTLKFIFTDEKSALAGTKGSEYYAMIVIPENFSKDIASSSTTNKQTATITYSPNEKRNYLASQILNNAVQKIESSIKASVNKEIVQELTDNLNSVPEKMSELKDGMNQLYDGSNQLSEGTDTLAEGTITFNSKFSEYENGLSSVKDGSYALNNGINTLNNGISSLLEGANKLTNETSDIAEISSGAKNIADGANAFNDSLILYMGAVDTLIENVNSTSNFLSNYVTNINPGIMNDPIFAAFINQLSSPTNLESIQALQSYSTQLKTACEQIKSSTRILADGTANLPQLKSALLQLSAGLSKVKSGVSDLSNGSQSLYSGISELNSAGVQLSNAAGDIARGSASVNKGASELNNGIDLANSGLDMSIQNANEELDSLIGLADYAEEPVTIEQDNITSVPNYGTAFAPYFLSLSLWVGAIIIFIGIYLDPDSRFKILSRYSNNKIARSFIYLLIGFAQAMILGIVLKYGLGLESDNLLLYYLSCCLVSLVFIAIVQFLMVFFKDLGKFLSLLLLILQLTSCGGTFPMETIPKIFNVLYPFMPMTYSVGLFKQAISGINSKELFFNMGILLIILIVFMILTILCSAVRSIKNTKNNVLIEESI